MEPERLGPDAGVGQGAAVGERRQSGGAERVGDLVEVGAEGGGVVVQARRSARGGDQRVQLGPHLHQLEADGLVGILAPPPLGQVHDVAVGLDRRRQPGGEVELAAAHRQVEPQLVQGAAVEAERVVAVGLERPGRDLGRHVGVAVAVAADPRPVAQDRPQVAGRLAVLLAEGAVEVGVQARDDVPDAGGDEEQPVAHLVLDRDRGRPHLVGRQQQPQPVERLPLGVVALGRRQRRALAGEAVQGRRGPVLMAEHRPPAGLGRVGRQRRLDVEAADQGPGVVGGEPAFFEVGDRLGDRLAARGACRGGDLALPVDADDLDLLGLVDQVEVRGQRAEHGRQRLRPGLVHLARQRVERRRALGAGPGQPRRRRLGHGVAVALGGHREHHPLDQGDPAGVDVGEPGGAGGGEGGVVGHGGAGASPVYPATRRRLPLAGRPRHPARDSAG